MAINIVNNGVHFEFSTPILQIDWSDAMLHNDALMTAIGERSVADPGREISNERGWQSRDDFLEWEGASVAALWSWMQTCIRHIYEIHNDGRFKQALAAAGRDLKFSGKAWANVNGPGSSNMLHNHPGATWSGVYYVEAPKNCGNIAFLDPRLSVNAQEPRDPTLNLFLDNLKFIEPRAGLTVIFPSWMLHLVKPNLSDRNRVSIAFNVKLALEPAGA